MLELNGMLHVLRDNQDRMFVAWCSKFGASDAYKNGIHVTVVRPIVGRWERKSEMERCLLQFHRERFSDLLAEVLVGRDYHNDTDSEEEGPPLHSTPSKKEQVKAQLPQQPQLKPSRKPKQNPRNDQPPSTTPLTMKLLRGDGYYQNGRSGLWFAVGIRYIGLRWKLANGSARRSM